MIKYLSTTPYSINRDTFCYVIELENLMHLFLSSFQDRSHHRDSMMVYFTRGSIFVVCVDKNGQTVSHMDAAVIVNTGKW